MSSYEKKKKCVDDLMQFCADNHFNRESIDLALYSAYEDGRLYGRHESALKSYAFGVCLTYTCVICDAICRRIWKKILKRGKNNG